MEQFCGYLEKSQTLLHIDLSGLNFEKEQLQVICPLLGSVTSLVGIHLSDMGIKRNPEDPDNDLMLEVLDYFGIDDSYAKEPKAVVNQHTRDPEALRAVVKAHYKLLGADALGAEGDPVEAKDYQNHIVMAKQGKAVAINKMINQAVVGQGIGRLDAGPADVCVLTRSVNSPELIFNACAHKDLYWEVDAGEKWQLSHKQGPTHDCYVC